MKKSVGVSWADDETYDPSYASAKRHLCRKRLSRQLYGTYAMKTALIMCMATSAAAEDIRCDMADGDTLEFSIDHNQFVDAVDAKEPPRRKVTAVRYGTRQFPAEPLVLGPVRGFHAEGLGGSTMMFVVQKDGTAVLTNRQEGLRVDGMCEVVN